MERNGEAVRSVPLRVVLYIRVSTDEQAQSGYSIPDQRRELLAHAKVQSWHVVDVIVDDGYSGAVGTRPGLDAVMELAEANKIDVVLAKKRNRLFRSRFYRLAYEKDLKELGVDLVSLDDTGNRFADAVNDEFGDWYREELTKNTVAGRMQKAREGKLIRIHTPIFGFEYTENGCGFVVVEHKMAIVERVIESIANGATLHNVKRGMEKDGIPAPAGGSFWNGGTIREIVREDAYRPVPYTDLAPMLTAEALARLDEDKEYGLVYYPRRKVTTLEPDPTRNYRRGQKVSWRPKEEQVPIPVISSGIPRETIDAARARIQNNRATRKKHSRVYQLAGLLRCEVCGCAMIANRKVRSDREHFYYRCATNQRDGYAKCSNNKGYVAGDTERRVLDAVLDAVKDRGELIAKATEDYEAKKRDLLRHGGDSTNLYRQLDKLERQRANYQRAFAADAMSLDDLSARTAELQGEKNHIEGLIAEHEEREERLKFLEEAHQKRVDLIRRGEWRRIGITQPEARRQRYQEIGLSAHADPVGNIRLSWGFGKESMLSVGTQSTRLRSGSRWKAEPSTCSPAGATAPTG
jgi:site-specific DNA recombinase